MSRALALGFGTSTQRLQAHVAQDPPNVDEHGHEASPSATLVTFIKKGDKLPKDWMPLKERRRSAADIQELGKHLERKYRIKQPLKRRRRASWSLPIFQSPKPASRFLRWDTIFLAGYVRGRVDFFTKETREKESILTSVRTRWRGSSSPSRRQLTNPNIAPEEYYGYFPWSQPPVDRKEIRLFGPFYGSS